MSEYERRRLENIERNRQILAQLEIPLLKPTLPPKPTKPIATKRISRPRIKDEPDLQAAERRRSGRLAAVKLGGTMVIKQERETVEVVKKPRRPDLVGPQPFEPEEGEEAKLKLQAIAKEVQPSNLPVPVSSARLPVSKRAPMGIVGSEGVIKACPARIYSLALHPTTDRLMAAAGDKEGYLSIWTCPAMGEDLSLEASSLFSFRPHRDTIPTIRFNPHNPAEIITCSYDQTVQAVDLASSAANWNLLHRVAFGDDRIICCLDQLGENLFLADSAGYLHDFDRRANRAQTYGLHERKMGGLSLCPLQPHLLATCSLDNVVAIWDRRKLSETVNQNESLISLPYRRAVTAVNWHPRRADRIVSTCYDDHVRIHRLNGSLTGLAEPDLEIPHNNQTGRWITVFKAFWDPKSTAEHETVILGNMNHGLDLIDGHSATLYNYQSDYLTSQPAVNAAHEHRDWIVSGNARGKLILWTQR